MTSSSQHVEAKHPVCLHKDLLEASLLSPTKALTSASENTTGKSSASNRTLPASMRPVRKASLSAGYAATAYHSPDQPDLWHRKPHSLPSEVFAG